MNDEQISAMKKYDWDWFCSQRVFATHMQSLPSEQITDKEEQSRLFQKFKTLSYRWDEETIDSSRYGWLSTIHSEALFQKLQRLSNKDLELLTLLFVEGYRQSEIAQMWKCSRNTIHKRLKKIKLFLRCG